MAAPPTHADWAHCLLPPCPPLLVCPSGQTSLWCPGPPPLPPRKTAGPTGCICLLHGTGVASWGLRLTPSILTAGKAVGLGISEAERAALTGLGAVMPWSWAWEGAWARLPGRTLRVLREPDCSWTAAQSCQGRSGEQGPVWELLGGCPCEVPVGLPGRLSELLDQNQRVGLGL